VWKRTLEGRALTFRLAGINNQNFIMRDEQTGSYWQQVSGKAISGPLRGKHLQIVQSDELSFALWQKESPHGQIMAPGAFKDKYDPANWEEEVAKLPTPLSFNDSGIADRELMLGITHNGEDKAYPYARLKEQKVIQDLLGGDPVIVVLAPDGQSARAFIARSPDDQRTIEFFLKTDSDWALVDSRDASTWNFQGCNEKGKCLAPLYVLKDYWFDWRNYHPNTKVYRH
jgi:hypothetical protein